MKKAIIITFLVIAFCQNNAFSQQNKEPSGYDELLFGATIEEFLAIFSGFNENTGSELERKNIKVYSRMLDPMRGSNINLHFYNNKFYYANVSYGTTSPDAIMSLNMQMNRRYGRFTDYKEVETMFGTYYMNYIYVNNDFTLTCTTIDRGGRYLYVVDYINPLIQKEIDELYP